MAKLLYTTQLQAGLGLIPETKALLELWSPGMSVALLNRAALDSGDFPGISARRLINIISECFAPRYLACDGVPANLLKRLITKLSGPELSQLMLIYTARANPILGDFIRDVYWNRYAAGSAAISNEDARIFVERAIDDGKTLKRWSESTVRRVSAYLTGCCADYGLLDRGVRSSRRIIPPSISGFTAAYLAHELHFAGVGDNSLLSHPDWQLFGLDRQDVLSELRKLSLTGVLILQAAGDVVRISWKQQSMEALCDVLTQS